MDEKVLAFTEDVRNCALCGAPVKKGQQAEDGPYRHKTCQFQCPVCKKQVDEKDMADGTRMRHRKCLLDVPNTQRVATQAADQMAKVCRNFQAVTGHQIIEISFQANNTIGLGIRRGSQGIVIPSRWN